MPGNTGCLVSSWLSYLLDCFFLLNTWLSCLYGCPVYNTHCPVCHTGFHVCYNCHAVRFIGCLSCVVQVTYTLICALAATYMHRLSVRNTDSSIDDESCTRPLSCLLYNSYILNTNTYSIVLYPGKGNCADPVNEDAILKVDGGGQAPESEWGASVSFGLRRR